MRSTLYEMAFEANFVKKAEISILRKMSKSVKSVGYEQKGHQKLRSFDCFDNKVKTLLKMSFEPTNQFSKI